MQHAETRTRFTVLVVLPRYGGGGVFLPAVTRYNDLVVSSELLFIDLIYSGGPYFVFLIYGKLGN